MAKNISNNQWFKDIADNVYINTAVVNNILFITVINYQLDTIKANTTISTLRNPELFQTTYTGEITNYRGDNIRVVKGKLIVSSDLPNSAIANTMLMLKSKQLEIDFYSPEQLAEMYQDDHAYHIDNSGIMNDDIPDDVKSESTIEPPVSDTEPTIKSEVINYD